MKMYSRAEHCALAEVFLHLVKENADALSEYEINQHLAEAQIHATLAIVDPKVKAEARGKLDTLLEEVGGDFRG